jgi:hypothetical protein
MAETPEDLQKQLNIFHDYCLAWKLKVNIDKTGSTEKQFLGPNRKVVADRAGTNVRK